MSEDLKEALGTAGFGLFVLALGVLVTAATGGRGIAVGAIAVGAFMIVAGLLKTVVALVRRPWRSRPLSPRVPGRPPLP